MSLSYYMDMNDGEIVGHVLAVQGNVAAIENQVGLCRVHMRHHGIPVGNEERAFAA